MFDKNFFSVKMCIAGGLMRRILVVIIGIVIMTLVFSGCTMSLDFHPQGKSSSSTR